MFLLSPLFCEAAGTCASGDRVTLRDGWKFLRSDVGSTWELVRPVQKGKPEEVPLWEDVTLPHTFNAEDCVDPDVNYYQGPGWYRTVLSVSNPYPSGRTVLEFAGSGQVTDVYIGMEKVGHHVGGYDKWSVDITDAVSSFLHSDIASRFGGGVPLAIRCDNSRDAERIPSTMSDFVVYGGIYRPLVMSYCPEVSMSSLRLDTSVDGKGHGSIDISAEIRNPDGEKTADVTYSLTSPSGKVVLAGRRKGVALDGVLNLGRFEVKSPELWDVASPALYRCDVELSVSGATSGISAETGFRSFVFEEKGPFLLNGRRLLLRGTHRHEDHAGYGAAVPDSIVRREMRMMKEMGANFIRLGHYQQSDLVLHLCDSLGILVWEEIPWCRGGIGGDSYKNQARSMLVNMISQHRNHPSVIIWGLGNENDWRGDFPEFDEKKIHDFMSELNGMAHDLDSSRKTAIRRCEFCSDIVDVYSPTIWAGWYSGAYQDYAAMETSAIGRYPHFLHAEWGGDSHAGRNAEELPERLDAGDRHGDWSESYIVRLFDWHLKEQEKMPMLTGAAFWTFKDFATPLRPGNPIPYVNQKGVVQRDLTPKESYYVFQSWWAEKPMLHIYGHDWPVRWGAEGQEREVLVYSNCSEVELFLNGKSLGVRKRDTRDFPAAGLHWNVKFATGHNELRAVAASERLEDSVALEYQTAAWGRPADFRAYVKELGKGRKLLTVQLVDADGNCCLDEAGFITFGIAGDGTLARNRGTATGSGKIQAANGRARIVVNAGEGKSCVSVKYQGLKTKLVEI